MIDLFWTKWRIKQLARGDALLTGKWLEDYARWLYARVWYRCQCDRAEAQKLLEETFVSAAGRLKEYTAVRCPMSEWLLSVYEQFAADFPVAARSRQPSPEVCKAVWCLSMQPISETEIFWPELTSLSQQALAMLACDEQRLLMCRYFRLERPANTAAQYGLGLSEIQTLLYRASHSFRRILETLTQAGGVEISQRGQMDSAILEANLEKIFRTLVPEVPTVEFMAQLKERIETVLVQNKPTGWSDSNKKKLYLGGVVAVGCGVMLGFVIWGGGSSSISKKKTKTFQNSGLRTQQNVPPSSSPDAAQEVQTAVRLGTAQDVEGLLGVLRAGTYPAQIAAAYYLGQYGDKSAINLLDQAAQKWYVENPGGTNPFIEAIAAIENRMRLRAKEELETPPVPPVQGPVVEEVNSSLKKKTIPEPNLVPVRTITEPKPQKHSIEPNLLPQEPDRPEPLLLVRVEPNQPLIIEEVNQLSPVDEPNLPVPEESSL
jgi:DNA-directed RNA polymerase specialized sigma24 family protein